MEELFTFGQAIEYLKSGVYMARLGWNGKNMYIGLQHPDKDSMMSQPYIYMKTADNQYIPWLASQADALSEDWVQVI